MHSDIHEGRTESFVSLAVSQTLYPVAYFSSLPGCIKAPRDPNNTPNLPIRPSLRAPYPINGTSSHSDAQIKKLESPLAPSPCLNPSFSWEFKKFRDVGVSQGNPSFSTEERILNMTPMGMLAKSRESSGGRRTLRKDYCLLSTLGILNLFPESYVQSVTAGFGSWATARLNLCAPCLGCLQATLRSAWPWARGAVTVIVAQETVHVGTAGHTKSRGSSTTLGQTHLSFSLIRILTANLFFYV